MPNMNEFLQQFGNAALNGVTGGVSGLIGGAGNVVSTLLTNAANAKQNQAIMDFNARESQLQRQFSLDQWKRETTYNSPAEQVKRLRDAGLNPALAMGGSIDNSAAPSPSLSEAQVGGLTPMRAPEIDPLTAAQIENIKADTAKKNAEASETSTLLPFKVQNMVSNNRLIGAQVSKLSAEEQDIYVNWSFRQVQLDIDNRMADSQINLWNKQAGLTDEMKLKTAEEYRQLVLLYDLKKQGIELTNQQVASQIHVNEAEAARLKRILSYMDSQEYLNYAQGDSALYNASANLSNASVNYFMAEFDANLKQSQADLAETQAEWLPFNSMNPRGEVTFFPDKRTGKRKIGGRIGR